MPGPSPTPSSAVAALAVSAAAFAIPRIATAADVADAPPLVWTRLADLPDPVGVAGPFVGVSNGALIVAGGANFPDAPPWRDGTKAWHDASHVLADGAWRTLPNALPTPGPLGYGVALTIADDATIAGVLCVGGADATRHYADVALLSWDGTTLHRRALTSLPRPLANAAGARIGSTIYVAGGTESPTATSASPALVALDLANPDDGWRELPPCPGPARMLAVAATVGDALYLVGGVSLAAGADGKPARTYLRDAWRYDPAARQWTRLGDLPRACAAAPSPAMNVPGGFAISGGDDGANVDFEPKDLHPGFARDALAYDAAADAWRVACAIPIAQVTTPLVPWRDGASIVASGEVRPGVRTPQVWSVAISPTPAPHRAATTRAAR